MNRINPPQRITDLKAQKLWSIDWAQETFPDSDFTFHVLLKVSDGSYEDHGWATDPSDAFALRREIVNETGCTKYFIRAQKVVKTYVTAWDDDDACLDSFRDWFAEGRGIVCRHSSPDKTFTSPVTGRSFTALLYLTLPIFKTASSITSYISSAKSLPLPLRRPSDILLAQQQAIMSLASIGTAVLFDLANHDSDVVDVLPPVG